MRSLGALAIALSAVITLCREITGRAKFSRRKRHSAENGTRIVVLGRDAFLIGNAIFGCVDKILCGANYSYYRENAERHGKEAAFLVGKITVNVRGNVNGDIVAAATAATAAITRLLYLAVKNNGVDYLYYCCRNVFACAAKLGGGTEIRAVTYALEYTYVALASVKYYSLFKHSHSLKFLTLSSAQARLKGYFNVELYTDRIKASVKSYGVYAYIGPRYTSAFCTNIRGMFDYFVAEIGQNDLYVLKTISVTAGVQNSVCFYANSLVFRDILIRNTARKSVIVLHNQSS